MSIDLATDFGPTEMATKMQTSEDRKYYPNFHYEGDKDLDIPDEGEMVIKFKRTARSESERDGKTRYSFSIDVCSIESIEDAAEDNSDNPDSYDDAASALDRIAEALKNK